MPLQSFLGRMYKRYAAQLLAASDKRLHLVQEVIQAIRIVKFFGWQESFVQRLSDLRERELSVLSKRMVVFVFQSMFLIGGSLTVAIATFGVHTAVLHR